MAAVIAPFGAAAARSRGAGGGIAPSAPQKASPHATAQHNLAHPAVVGRARPLPPLVMLDPGHGGKDPGAIGITGEYEKHIALATAQVLKNRLERNGQYRVVLTRTRDEFIPLDDRVSIAQEHGARLFMSMHADALADPHVRGASVYTLAGMASDAQSAALAQHENNVDRFGPAPFLNQPPDVARILASLVRQETRGSSARLQRSVVDALGQSLPMLQKPARHAAFVVLKAADIPSVLVEMGFMSNHQDEAALRRPDHRAQVALALHKAVDSYFAAADSAGQLAG